MSKKKYRSTQTDTNLLISSIRGEVGELIASWHLYRDLMLSFRKLRTSDSSKDFLNPELNRIRVLINKLEDDMVSRLSELAARKVGRTNFFFASQRFKVLTKQVEDFESFVGDNKFRERRNKFISHKELPVRWEDVRAEPSISSTVLLKAIAKALRLTKRIDGIHLGPRAKYLWIEMRRRKELFMPGKIAYTILPYLRLPDHVRIRIVLEEQQLGKPVWEEIETKVNGVASRLKACKEWGILNLGDRFLVLSQYPLIELKEINDS
jgi:hypothetical protein